MNGIVLIALASAFYESTDAVSKEFVAMAIAARDKCLKEFKIDESVVNDYMIKMKMPETQEGKCMVACYLEEATLLDEGKMNVPMFKETNKYQWDDAAIVQKANKNVDKCDAEISPDGKNKCDFAADVIGCLIKYGKEDKIPIPDFEHPTKR